MYFKGECRMSIALLISEILPRRSLILYLSWVTVVSSTASQIYFTTQGRLMNPMIKTDDTVMSQIDSTVPHF